MLSSGASYRQFYLALDRLKARRAVTMESDPRDGRARIIALARALDQS